MMLGGKIWYGGYFFWLECLFEVDSWGLNVFVGVCFMEKIVGVMLGGNYLFMDWGIFLYEDEEKGDWVVVSWVVE